MIRCSVSLLFALGQSLAQFERDDALQTCGPLDITATYIWSDAANITVLNANQIKNDWLLVYHYKQNISYVTLDNELAVFKDDRYADCDTTTSCLLTALEPNGSFDAQLYHMIQVWEGFAACKKINAMQRFQTRPGIGNCHSYADGRWFVSRPGYDPLQFSESVCNLSATWHSWNSFRRAYPLSEPCSQCFGETHRCVTEACPRACHVPGVEPCLFRAPPAGSPDECQACRCACFQRLAVCSGFRFAEETYMLPPIIGDAQKDTQRCTRYTWKVRRRYFLPLLKAEADSPASAMEVKPSSLPVVATSTTIPPRHLSVEELFKAMVSVNLPSNSTSDCAPLRIQLLSAERNLGPSGDTTFDIRFTLRKPIAATDEWKLVCNIKGEDFSLPQQDSHVDCISLRSCKLSQLRFSEARKSYGFEFYYLKDDGSSCSESLRLDVPSTSISL